MSRSNSSRSASQPERNGSPSIPPRRQKSKDYDAGAKSPDPAEFEKAFVIEDESEEPSRTGTPSIPGKKAAMAKDNAPATSGSANGNEKEVGVETPPPEAVIPSSNELPQEVRTKLRRLEALESKYKGTLLLKRYL